MSKQKLKQLQSLEKYVLKMCPKTKKNSWAYCGIEPTWLTTVYLRTAVHHLFPTPVPSMRCYEQMKAAII